MRKAVVIGVLVAVFAFATSGTAAAFDLRIAPGGVILPGSVGPIVIRGPLGITTSCDMDLTGLLNTGPIARNGNAGNIASGLLSNCTVRSALLFSGNWIIQPQTLLGDAPMIGVLANLTNVQFSITVLGVTCLYQGTVPILIGQVSGTSNTITVLANSLATTSGGICDRASFGAGQRFTSVPGMSLSR